MEPWKKNIKLVSNKILYQPSIKTTTIKKSAKMKNLTRIIYNRNSSKYYSFTEIHSATFSSRFISSTKSKIAQFLTGLPTKS